MKKNILKKIFIKISKFLGYEIIDQNTFTSPTLEKKLNDDLSIINQKSIVLPLGEVKITKKVSSILIIFRSNTNIEIWDQNKKRLLCELQGGQMLSYSIIRIVGEYKSRVLNQRSN